MSDVGNAFRIPMFLAASDRDGLVRLMLANNLRAGKEFRYFDITKDKKEWVAWFYDVIPILAANILPKKVGE